MGRCWTGYTSIADGRACIVHSHGALWLLAPPCCRQSSPGYGLFEAKIPSEKMRLITAYGVRNVRYAPSHSPPAPPPPPPPPLFAAAAVPAVVALPPLPGALKLMPSLPRASMPTR